MSWSRRRPKSNLCVQLTLLLLLRFHTNLLDDPLRFVNVRVQRETPAMNAASALAAGLFALAIGLPTQTPYH
jgi:hypothetical protein